MKQQFLFCLALATMLAPGLARGTEFQPVKAYYLPVGDKQEGCPNFVQLNPSSLQSVDFLHTLYRKALIKAENTGEPLTYRYLVQTADLQPNTLVVTMKFTEAPHTLTWDESLRDRQGKPLKTVDGLCGNGQYMPRSQNRNDSHSPKQLSSLTED